MVQPTQETNHSSSTAFITHSKEDAVQERSFFIAEVAKILFTSIRSVLWFVPSLLIQAFSDLTSSSIPVNETTGVPVALHDLLDIVEKKAETQGIYRISGSATELNNLTKQISEGNADGISDTMFPHLAAGTAKKMLREMPNEQKIFPAEVINLENLEGDKKLEAAKTIISALNPQKKAFLTRLLNHIEVISAHSEKNKMTKSNLAIVLAPNLFAQHKDLSQELAAVGERNTLFMYVAENRTELGI